MADGKLRTLASPSLHALPRPPELSENAVREAIERDDTRRAAQLALELYGAEVFGFLAGVLDNPADAREVYSVFTERLWKSLERFRWHCSLRTWSYALARNELNTHRTKASRRAKRHIPLSEAPSIAVVERSNTPSFQRTTLRDMISLLRAALSPEDHDILVLRVDRRLAWRDVAVTFLGDANEEAISRESVRLRQRFALIKQQLSKAVTAHGIVAAPRQTDGNFKGGSRGRVIPLGRSRGDR